MVRRNLLTVDDERVRAATGAGRDHWFGLLDEAGAREWTHPAIAAFLRERGVPAWWSQHITVAYEQERGLRLPGQRPDGTFAASVSRTFGASPEQVWPALVGDVAAWLGPGWVVTGVTVGSALRLVAPDGSRAVVGVQRARADSPSKARVTVQHARIAAAEDVERVRTRWREAFDRLARLLV